MLLSEYEYELPPELIAQEPAEPRDAARLLVLDRGSGTVRHCRVSDLPEVLSPSDALVLNDTRVLAARLRAKREETGGRVEVLLLRASYDISQRETTKTWEALARPARKLRPGEQLRLASSALLTVGERLADGLIEVSVPEEVASDLPAHGELPLPPYIKGYHGDADRYQTVYAASDGSVAAPTAGLHFTPELLDRLAERGVSTHTLTLHVGLGTFRSVETENVEEHVMHAEPVYVPRGLPEELAKVRARGGRVVAVGTTSARALEAVAACPEQAGRWTETDIFIRPGHQFRLVDALLTNFHLPRTTLLMLVSALAGRERVLAAYEQAVRERYRFYSFGDAMLVL